MTPLLTQTFLTLVILTNRLHFEVADTAAERQRGLMYRHEWGQTDGMFFIHDQASRVAYWMKNTYLDMRILYFDNELNLIDVIVPTPLSTEAHYSSTGTIRYVLEIKPELLGLVRDHSAEFRSEMIRALRSANLPPGDAIPSGR